MSSHMAAGQLQQRPTAREGGLFKRAWFDNPVKYVPKDCGLSAPGTWRRPEDGGDYTVGVKMGINDETNQIYIIEVTARPMVAGQGRAGDHDGGALGWLRDVDPSAERSRRRR